jgi:hypothetical protein
MPKSWHASNKEQAEAEFFKDPTQSSSSFDQGWVEITDLFRNRASNREQGQKRFVNSYPLALSEDYEDWLQSVSSYWNQISSMVQGDKELTNQHSFASSECDKPREPLTDAPRDQASQDPVALAPHSAYNSDMENKEINASRITAKTLLCGGCAGFLFLLTAFGGGWLALDSKIERKFEQVDSKFARVDDNFDRLELKIDGNTHAIASLNERTAKVETKLDGMDEDIKEIKGDMKLLLQRLPAPPKANN